VKISTKEMDMKMIGKDGWSYKLSVEKEIFIEQKTKSGNRVLIAIPEEIAIEFAKEILKEKGDKK
jgi:hypothetical protein